VPADATAVVVNVTAVNPSAAGFVTVYPCSDSVSDTSTLNYVAGQTVANTTIAALSGAGQLCVWTFAETDILVDITGWLGPAGLPAHADRPDQGGRHPFRRRRPTSRRRCHDDRRPRTARCPPARPRSR
jgi:hypothetical protein